jgi:hypothetical protein
MASMSVRRLTLTILASLAALSGGLSLSSAPAFAAESCPNEAFRSGLAAKLPDCRAYELVTPADKGVVQDLFQGGAETTAKLAPDGSRIALRTVAALEPSPNPAFVSNYMFSRDDASGWKMTSLTPPEAGQTGSRPQLFSPDLSHVGLLARDDKTAFEPGLEQSFDVGPPGGPYTTIATTPSLEKHFLGDVLLGASADFHHVVLGSTDHTLLSATPTGSAESGYDLYEWVNGQLRLVNVTGSGSVIGRCGATLGQGASIQFGFAHNAVSADGSKVFFTAPDPQANGLGAEGCFEQAASFPTRGLNAPRLYMRVTEMVGGREEGKTEEVSVPDPDSGVTLSAEEEEYPVTYQDASADGSRVLFTTYKALTPGATKKVESLYEYNSDIPVAERLKLIYQGPIVEHEIILSGNGSVVYFVTPESHTAGGEWTLYRYDAVAGGAPREIATVDRRHSAEGETPYSTPDGRFLLFAAKKVAGEPRSEGHNELYLYDNADGSVTCVSCGPGRAPKGDAFAIVGFVDYQLKTLNRTPESIPMSDDGKHVFFNGTASLVPQAVNSEEEGGLFAFEGVTNVYEWEPDGTGACTQSAGCTYLISQGNSPANSYLLGASSDGSNVFIGTHAQLLSQDVDSYGDIYDARVNGGFPPPPSASGACQGDACVSPPAAPNDATPASSSFSGPGDLTPMPATVKSKAKAKAKPKRCRKGTVRRKGKCVKRKAARRAVKHNRGGSK